MNVLLHGLCMKNTFLVIYQKKCMGVSDLKIFVILGANLACLYAFY